MGIFYGAESRKFITNYANNLHGVCTNTDLPTTFGSSAGSVPDAHTRLSFFRTVVHHCSYLFLPVMVYLYPKTNQICKRLKIR